MQLYWSQHSNPLEGWFHYRHNVDAKFWLMNLTEWDFWYVCTLISNLDMQNKIIFQILPVSQRPFHFLPGNYTELQWHPVATRHRHRQTCCDQTQKKISASLCHLLINNNNLPQQQHPQRRGISRNARAAGIGGWEQPEHRGRPVFCLYIHTFWEELNHQLIEESFCVFQIPLIYNGKQKSSLLLQIIINKISGNC